MFFYEYPVERIAEACEMSEYDGIEFWIETPHYWVDRSERKLNTVKEWVRSVHCAVLDLNPCSVNELVVDTTLRTNLRGINVAGIMKSPFTVHAGRRSALRVPVREDYEANERYFRILSRFAGVKEVVVLLENSEPKINNLCKSYEEVINWAEKFGFGITFDVNHALKNGDAGRYIESVERIKNIHVSGSDGKGRHIGSRFSKKAKKILEMLEDAGYDGLITVELDDLGYGRMDFQEKIEELKKEKEFLDGIFRR